MAHTSVPQSSIVVQKLLKASKNHSVVREETLYTPAANTHYTSFPQRFVSLITDVPSIQRNQCISVGMDSNATTNMVEKHET